MPALLEEQTWTICALMYLLTLCIIWVVKRTMKRIEEKIYWRIELCEANIILKIMENMENRE
jgi:hypothetical protein